MSLILFILYFGWKSIRIDNSKIILIRFLGLLSKSILLNNVNKVYLGKGIDPSLPFTVKIFFEENDINKSESFNIESRKDNLVMFLVQIIKSDIEIELSKSDLCRSIYNRALEVLKH